MPNQAINQFPEVTSLLDGDLLYTVRGTTDHSVDASTFAGRILVAEVVIPTAQVLTIGTTPVQIVAAPAADKVLIPLITVYQYLDGTTPFTTSADLCIESNGGGVLQTAIGMGDETQANVMGSNGGASAAGASLRATTTDADDPVGGDFDLRVVIYYTIADAD